MKKRYGRPLTLLPVVALYCQFLAGACFTLPLGRRNRRRITSHTAPISANEYRVAVRAPNGLDGIHNYHVIYQLSDGTWAGKDATAPSKHFGRTNPSTTPAMWSNNAYSPSAGTIYFAVRRW